MITYKRRNLKRKIKMSLEVKKGMWDCKDPFDRLFDEKEEEKDDD